MLSHGCGCLWRLEALGPLEQGGHVLVISLLYIKIEGRDRILPGSPRSACLVYTAVNSKTPCLQ